VRALLRAGKEVEGLVDKNVLAYIQKHGLYVDVDVAE
jgi:nicotinic acid mononucleotide adenylyltransferase